MIIPSEYYTEEKEVKLTQQDIDIIIDHLNRIEHNLFIYMDIDKIIKKLKGEK